jgi:GT2 family glycosyltransferase
MGINLTIIVVNYNTCSILSQCLEYLERLDNAFNIQVIVVDNASSDGSAEMVLARFPSCFLIRNQSNVGFARANNQGIRLAKGDFTLLLNSDAFLTSVALYTLVDYATQNSRVGICGPQLLNADRSWQRSYELIPSPRSAMLHALGFTSIQHIVLKALWKLTGDRWAPKSVDYVDGACMLIRNALVEQIGVLDERFFLFVEDAEFCHRTRQHGWKVVYVPKSRVVHLRGQSSSRKSTIHTHQLMRQSLEMFVVSQFGPAGWDTYRRWTRMNFRWRFRLCTFASRLGLIAAGRNAEYSEAYSVYE